MTLFHSVTNFLMVLSGVLIACLGLESFLLPNNFIDGGVTGLSMLLAKLTQLPLGVFLLIVNCPFIILSYRHIGKDFALKSMLGILALALCTSFIHFPVATQDKFLSSLFGGFFVGAGVGLAIRGGGVLDGTEVLALILSKKTFATVGEVILVLNVIIFSFATFFIGIENALYSIITYIAAFKTIDYLLYGIEAYNSVVIFSNQQEDIRESILKQFGRGCSIQNVKGGYSGSEQEVLYCIVTRLELNPLENLVKLKDKNAFIVVSPVNEVIGGMVKQSKFH